MLLMQFVYYLWQFALGEPITPLKGPSEPSYGTCINDVIVPLPEIATGGACPICHIGILEYEYTCVGLLCLVLLFPVGILCCLALKKSSCSYCGASFGR